MAGCAARRDNAANSARRREMQRDFAKKASLIIHEGGGHAVEPERYYRDMMGADADHTQVVYDGTRPRTYANIADAVAASECSARSYIYPMRFFHHWPSDATMQRAYCLTVDLDDMSAASVHALIADHWGYLTPTYVVNSGHGLHLVYILTEPVECYHAPKRALRRIHEGLLAYYATYGADRGCALMHAYRVAGSRTKIGTIATAYRIGQPWPIEELASFVNVDWRTEAARHGRPAQQGQVLHLPAGARGLVPSYIGLARDVVTGHRYDTMLAIVTVCYKCHVPREGTVAILRDLQRHWNARDREPITDREIDKVMRAYNNEAVHVRADTLARWMGRTATHYTRNGRTRAEHLANVHASRREATRTQIATYLQAHPDASDTEIAAAVGRTRDTVRRYRRELDAQPVEPETVPELPRPATTPAEVRDLYLSIIAETDVGRRERLIQHLPPDYQQTVRSMLSG